MLSWFLLDLSHVHQHFSGGWRWNPGEQPLWNLELCREGLFICWIWVVITLQMQSLQSVWTFIQHCPSLNTYLHIYPIFFFFFWVTAFSYENLFPSFVSLYLPQFCFFSLPAVFSFEQINRFLVSGGFSWLPSSSIRSCYGSINYISCIYQFVSSIFTSWGLLLLKYRAVMLYKFLKGW